jgi:hypothetical protein
MLIPVDHKVLGTLLAHYAATANSPWSIPTPEMARLATEVSQANDSERCPIFMRLPKCAPFSVPEAHVVFVAKLKSLDKAAAMDVLQALMRDGKDLLLSEDAGQYESLLGFSQECAGTSGAPAPNIFRGVYEPPEEIEIQDPVTAASGLEAANGRIILPDQPARITEPEPEPAVEPEPAPAPPPEPPVSVGPPPVKVTRKKKATP